MVVTETPSKNAFYFTWKALSFLRSLNFCPVFFSNVDKRLYKKPKVNFKIEIYMFINISRNKSNQAIKFGKLTKFNMRNVFSLKTIYKMWLRNCPRSSVPEVSKSLQFIFIVLPGQGLPQYIETKVVKTCFYLI